MAQNNQKLPIVAKHIMAKKNILLRARVVTGKRWYIDYTAVDVTTGEEKRRRQGFDLDEIPDLQVRKEVAERLARYLDTFLPAPAGEPPKNARSNANTLHNCLYAAVAEKTAGPRKSSGKNYRTVARYLIEWAGQRAHMPPEWLDKRQAAAFRDHLKKTGKYTGRTLNNYVNALRTLWYEMQEQETVSANPWAMLKPVREAEKRRRVFTADERRTVAAELQRSHYFLFRAVLLLYYCFIRPAEMCRLRRRNFDLDAGVVLIEKNQAKMWKSRVVTIPRTVLPFFQDERFVKLPANAFVFGRGWAPQSLHPLNPVRLMKAHRAVLEALHAAGKLADISGLTLYSWKDTGITTHARKTSPLATRDQAGHHDLAQTMQYYHADMINPEYRDLIEDLFGQ